MHQVLFRIPLYGPWTLGPLQVPGFGVGVVLLVWCLFALWWGVNRWRKGDRLSRTWAFPAFVWVAVTGAILLVPRLAIHSTEQKIQFVTRLLQQRPGDVKLLLARADLYAQKLDFQAALSDYQSAVANGSDQAATHERLAWFLATCPDQRVRNGQEALKEAKIACRLSGFRKAEPLQALAAAYAETGEFDRAVQAARLSARLAGSGAAGSHFSLSRLRKQLGCYLHHRAWRSRYGPSAPVFGYGFMLFCAFLLGGWAASRRAVREGFPSEMIWDLAVWLFVAGIVGARIFYVVQKHSLVFGQAHSLWDYLFEAINLREGGLVFYGSVLGGLAGFAMFCHRRKLHPLQIADLVVPSIFLGLAAGRIGCFLNGCCFGDVCHLPWAVRFPLGSIPDMTLVERGFLLPDSPFTLPLHPTQLYSSLNGLVLACLTSAWFTKRKHFGEISALGLFAYPVTRFLLEILRGDELGQFGTRLTISQWVSFGMFLLGVLLMLWVKRYGKPAEVATTSSN